MQMLSLPVITIAALSSLQTSIHLVSEPGPDMRFVCPSLGSHFPSSQLAAITRCLWSVIIVLSLCSHWPVSPLPAVSGVTESDCAPRAPQSDRGTRAKQPGITARVIMDRCLPSECGFSHLNGQFPAHLLTLLFSRSCHITPTQRHQARKLLVKQAITWSVSNYLDLFIVIVVSWLVKIKL